MSNEFETDDHDAEMARVESGRSVILSDETLPLGRFQLIAHVVGSPESFQFILLEWRERNGQWESRHVANLHHDAPMKLVELVRKAGITPSGPRSL